MFCAERKSAKNNLRLTQSTSTQKAPYAANAAYGAFVLAAGFHTLYVRLRSAPQATLLLIPAADRCLRLHRLRLPCRHRTARPPFPAPRALSAARLVHRDRTVPRPVIPPAPTPPRPHPPRTHRPRALPHPHPSRAAPTVPRPAVHPPHRACTHSPTRLLSVRAYRVPAPVPACLPTEVLKLQDFSFYQSISSFVVSLPNVSEKDVKGLLFRK